MIDFLRRSTDLGDAQILNIFDLLDPEGRGTIGFAEFYYLVLLLMAMKEVLIVCSLSVMQSERGSEHNVFMQISTGKVECVHTIYMAPLLSCTHIPHNHAG